MKTEPQNSIQKRMREIYIKLKGFTDRLSDQSDFEGYSLCLDRLDNLLADIVTETTKAHDEKKEASKQIKAKNNQLKEMKKECETIRKEKEDAKEKLSQTINSQKNTIAELKRKLETAKGATDYYQYQKLREENVRLQMQINKDEVQIYILETQKMKMVSLVDHNALKKELSECQKSLDAMCNWERKFQMLSDQNRTYLQELERHRLTIKHLQSVIQTQRQEISNDGEIISCLIDDDQKVSLNSSETCESTNDYQTEDIDILRAKKKKKPRRRGGNHRSRSKIHTIPQDPDEATEKQTEQPTTTQPQPLAAVQSNAKNVKSFSIVMFILAGVLAIPYPAWIG